MFVEGRRLRPLRPRAEAVAPRPPRRGRSAAEARGLRGGLTPRPRGTGRAVWRAPSRVRPATYFRCRAYTPAEWQAGVGPAKMLKRAESSSEVSGRLGARAGTPDSKPALPPARFWALPTKWEETRPALPF
ncbi:hypothetical protein VULLAG_LOCUS14300 [Vulpes lagopus]